MKKKKKKKLEGTFAGLSPIVPLSPLMSTPWVRTATSRGSPSRQIAPGQTTNTNSEFSTSSMVRMCKKEETTTNRIVAAETLAYLIEVTINTLISNISTFNLVL